MLSYSPVEMRWIVPARTWLTGCASNATWMARCRTSTAFAGSGVSAAVARVRSTAEYKRRILREAAACAKPGEIGALLRREGLYTSHLSAWRRARERGELAGLAPKKRGPQARRQDPRDKRIAELERETRRLKARVERAEALLEVPKKSRSSWGSSGPGTRNPDADRR